MNKDNVLVITDREELYNKCENMEQLFSNYYLPLLEVHYRKTYNLQKEIKELKEDYSNEVNENLKLSELWLKTTKERDLYKSVIEEVREYIKINRLELNTTCCDAGHEEDFEQIMNILDKSNIKESE